MMKIEPDNELENVLPINNAISELNQGEIKKWVEEDFDEATKDILIDEVINSTASKDVVDSDEDDVFETNYISWNQAADPFNKFIKFSERSSSFNGEEIMRLHNSQN